MFRRAGLFDFGFGTHTSLKPQVLRILLPAQDGLGISCRVPSFIPLRFTSGPHLEYIAFSLVSRNGKLRNRPFLDFALFEL